MRYGFISHIVGAVDSGRILRDTIELAAVTEESGYDARAAVLSSGLRRFSAMGSSGKSGHRNRHFEFERG